MKKPLIISSVLLVVFLLIGYIGYNLSLEKATLTVGSNQTIKMDNITYIVYTDTISKDELDGKVGRVWSVVEIGTHDPKTYENSSYIYKVKGKSIKNKAALKRNGKFYIIIPK